MAVEQGVHFGQRHLFFFHEIENDRGIDVATSGPHDQPSQRGQPH